MTEEERKQDIKDRFSSMLHPSKAIHGLTGFTNVELHLNNILDLEDHAEAERQLIEVIEADTANSADPVVIESRFQESRKREYAAEGVTLEEMIVALFEKVVEGKSEMADALQAKRLLAKGRSPKPS